MKPHFLRSTRIPVPAIVPGVKQAGNRLQQLPDTCCAKRSRAPPASSPVAPYSRLCTVLKLHPITTTHLPDPHEVLPSLNNAHVSDGGSPSPSPSASDHTMGRTGALACTACALVHTDVLSANAAMVTLRRCQYCLGNPLIGSTHSPEPHTFSQPSRVNTFESTNPCLLRAIDPIVTFVSPSEARSWWPDLRFDPSVVWFDSSPDSFLLVQVRDALMTRLRSGIKDFVVDDSYCTHLK